MAEPAMAQASETERTAPGGGNGEDDALLARIASQRDREAFAALFARHEHAAFNLALHLTGRRALAEECVHWAAQDDIPPSHSWYRDATTSKRPTTVIYLFDDYLVKVFAGQAMAMRRYEEPYPTDRILISLTNYFVEKMVVKNIAMDEIPKEFQDPAALIEKYKFQRDERTFPDRMKVPQATDQR